MVENYLRATGFYYVSRIGVIRRFHPMLAALVERWRPETHTFVLPIGEVTVTLEDVAHIFGLPIDGKPVSGWTDSSGEFVQRSTLFTDKSTAYAHAKYLPLLRNFERIHTYSWGSACLAHLYRILCRASRYDTKEMDGPLNLLFVWAWERMPCLAPVPRQTLPPAMIPVSMRWSYSERTTAWSSKNVETFRHDIDYMQEAKI
ncbi:protein MAIN-LIKE 2-like [Arachis stenosperma]|uniref:protein MAIN-LIKE 2-like n=1 Tax=Arachis stenosperma TaxID=217475 RepID=UPI0025AC2EFC|nr:protein MAIN-LIKE 2-like [Arachis stenosperma]